MRVNEPVTQRDVPVDANANILSTTDKRGWITHVNDDFVRISGFAREDLLGQPHNIIRHPDMPRLAFEQVWNTLKSGRSWMGLVKNRCKNGDHYWVHAYATPITDDQGNVVEYQSVRSGPTSEAAIERAQRLYRKLGQSEPKKGALPQIKAPRSCSLLAKLGWALAVTVVLQLGLLLAFAPDIGAVFALLAPLPLLVAALVHACWTLRRLTARAREVVDDPHMQWVLTGRWDDVGAVEMALLNLRTELSAVTKRLADTIAKLNASATEVGQSVQETGQDMDEQARRAEEIAAAATEMAQTVEQIAYSGARAATAAGQARAEVDRGRQAVAARIGHSAEVIGRLAEHAARISDVVGVIQKITSQTNLLALNAAIEAARAGESGRGFAVVADEVRQLASRTHESTHTITGSVSALREVAEEAVQVIGASREDVEQTLEHAHESEQVLDHIVAAVDQIQELNMEIASATEEQSAVAEEINRNMVSISDLSRATAGRSGDAGKRVAALVEEVAHTRRLVERFTGALRTS